jgi:hypothetical protein
MSSIKMEKRAEQVLPGKGGGMGGWRGEEGSRRQGREMAQTMYAHMNK